MAPPESVNLGPPETIYWDRVRSIKVWLGVIIVIDKEEEKAEIERDSFQRT